MSSGNDGCILSQTTRRFIVRDRTMPNDDIGHRVEDERPIFSAQARECFACTEHDLRVVRVRGRRKVALDFVEFGVIDVGERIVLPLERPHLERT
jgi:hypothetical protein